MQENSLMRAISSTDKGRAGYLQRGKSGSGEGRRVTLDRGQPLPIPHCLSNHSRTRQTRIAPRRGNLYETTRYAFLESWLQRKLYGQFGGGPKKKGQAIGTSSAAYPTQSGSQSLRAG